MRRMLIFLLSFVLLSSALSACSTHMSGEHKVYNTAEISTGVTYANSEFAFDIFKKLNGEDYDKNIFISPISISTALAMTYNGAKSTTKEAMANVLGFSNLDDATVNLSYRNLLNYLENADKKVELSTANSVWIKEGTKINEDFLSNIKSNFNSEVDVLDFSKDSAAGTINKWISDATRGKIDKMVDSPIDPGVIMYLINAIYFKGKWSTQFDPKKTCGHDFKTYNGSIQTVSMMNSRVKVDYMQCDDYRAVRLPYGEGKISMYCILPPDGVDINDFIQKTDVEYWDNIRKSMIETDDVVLKIPRFKLEYGIRNLNDSLKALGMGEAFSGSADFSGIREGICISRVLHKAVIEVNEEGSEAAAATVVEMRESAVEEPKAFIADRPFVFIIADDATGAILFMGKLLSVD